ncbi:cell cycle exit and neuronal differentiation protein 1-like, partial [Acipenser oxyrinchus oxyrinchus]
MDSRAKPSNTKTDSKPKGPEKTAMPSAAKKEEARPAEPAPSPGNSPPSPPQSPSLPLPPPPRLWRAQSSLEHRHQSLTSTGSRAGGKGGEGRGEPASRGSLRYLRDPQTLPPGGGRHRCRQCRHCGSSAAGTQEM